MKIAMLFCAALIAGCAPYPSGPSLTYVDALRPAQRIVLVADRTWVIDSGCSIEGQRLICGGMTEELSIEQANVIGAAIGGLTR